MEGKGRACEAARAANPLPPPLPPNPPVKLKPENGLAAAGAAPETGVGGGAPVPALRAFTTLRAFMTSSVAVSIVPFSSGCTERQPSASSVGLQEQAHRTVGCLASTSRFKCHAWSWCE